MNFLSTGVKEVTRRLLRQKNRLALANARKIVERTEIELGRHGWRELVNDERVRPAYDELLRLDETLAAAHTRIAELEHGVQEQETVREAARREHQETLARLDAERAPVQARLDAAQERIAELSKLLPEQNSKRTALQSGQRELLKEERRARWTARAGSPERINSQQAFDERRTALAEQATQLALERSTLAEPIAAGHREIKEIRAALRELDAKVAEARAELTVRERAVAVAVAERVKEISVTRRQAARIEEEKSESYLTIGHRLAEVTDVEETAPTERPARAGEGYDLFLASREHRQSYARLLGDEAASLQASRDADKQDLRIFNFVALTTAVLVALACLLIFRTPGRREWLPGDTQALVSVNVKDFTDADFTRTLQQHEPDAWQAVWSGLVQKVAEVPQIDVRKQVAHISRALAPGHGFDGAPIDCLLVDFRSSVDVDDLVRNHIRPEGGFGTRNVGGLPIYEKRGIALAQIGPDTVALGSWESVETLIRVRLGLPSLPKPNVPPGDLKTDEQIFSDFSTLDEDSAFRLVTHRPRELTYLTDPLLNTPLLPSCESLGLTLDMHEPVSATFVLHAARAADAAGIVKVLEATPDQVLQLASAGPNLFVERPTVTVVHDTQVEWKFRMTAPAAKEFLQKVSRVGLAAGQAKVATAK